MWSLRKAVFSNLRPDSVAWNHGSLRSFKPGFESQPGRHLRRIQMSIGKGLQDKYQFIQKTISSLLEDEDDWISAMATVVSELHNNFDHFNWTGFYRVVSPQLLKIGPYQGTHGCLTIPFSKGICGFAALKKETQIVPDVSKRKDHIACSPTTSSELVVPILDSNDEVFAVLDIDSDMKNAFTKLDILFVERLCTFLGIRYG